MMRESILSTPKRLEGEMLCSGYNQRATVSPSLVCRLLVLRPEDNVNTMHLKLSFEWLVNLHAGCLRIDCSRSMPLWVLPTVPGEVRLTINQTTW
jgi:hypothetical protein